MTQVVKLIRWLMCANPSERPSAAEVLRSELVPATIGDDQLTDLLRSLPDHPETAERVVDALFGMQPADDAAHEAAGAPSRAEVQQRTAATAFEAAAMVLCFLALRGKAFDAAEAGEGGVQRTCPALLGRVPGAEHLMQDQ
jgi:hypothetical protein